VGFFARFFCVNKQVKAVQKVVPVASRRRPLPPHQHQLAKKLARNPHGTTASRTKV